MTSMKLLKHIAIVSVIATPWLAFGHVTGRTDPHHGQTILPENAEENSNWHCVDYETEVDGVGQNKELVVNEVPSECHEHSVNEDQLQQEEQEGITNQDDQELRPLNDRNPL